MNDVVNQRVLTYSEILPFIKTNANGGDKELEERKFHELMIQRAKENNVPIREPRQKSNDSDRGSLNSDSSRPSMPKYNVQRHPIRKNIPKSPANNSDSYNFSQAVVPFDALSGSVGAHTNSRGS